MRARRSTEWKGWNPDRHTASFASFAKHPQAIDQQYLISWNNRQALGFARVRKNPCAPAEDDLDGEQPVPGDGDNHPGGDGGTAHGPRRLAPRVGQGGRPGGAHTRGQGGEAEPGQLGADLARGPALPQQEREH